MTRAAEPLARAASATNVGLLTFERLQDLQRPMEVALSPNGERIAFTVAPAAKEVGKSLDTRLWLGSVDGERAPFGEPGATNALPLFSPDSSMLAYASDEGHSGRMSLRIEGRGSVGSIAGSVEDMRWSPDGRTLLVLAADVGSDRAGAQSATKIHEQEAAEQDPRVVRPAQYWRRLWLVDVDSGETADVTPPAVNVFEFDWVGNQAVAVCTDDPSESAWYGAWLGLIDIASRRVERIHVPETQIQCPRISSNGRIAWIEGLASDRAVVTGTVNVRGSGPLAPELDVTWLAFLDEETLWFAGWRSCGSLCGRLKLDGSVEELAGGDLLIGTRHQPRVSPAEGTRVAAVLEGSDEPPEVAILEAHTWAKLTSLNQALAPELKVAEWQSYRWTSFDGLEIEGLLALPRRRTDPLPLIVYVHGGPTGTWSWRVLPQPLLLAQDGYAVFLPNPRGSAGRGQEFARANVGDLGGGDLRDILAGVDALVHDGTADDARVGITGGSYGGFMAAWAVTQTDRFAAAVPYAVSTNWLSFHLTTNIGRFDTLFMDADPYDLGGAYPERSAVYFAHQCVTPTLLLHGEDDLCTPLSQATEFYNALVERAQCEVELVIYPREGHGWLERDHQVDVWHRTRDWFARHLSPPGNDLTQGVGRDAG